MRIKDLNETELYNFINEYYENNTTVRELLDKYNLEDSKNFIQSITVYSDDICEVCGGKVKYNLQSRVYIKNLENNHKICEDCGHTTDSICYCQKCIEFRSKEEAKKRKEKIEKLRIIFNRPPVSIEDLKLDEILFVLLLNNAYGKEIGFIYEKDKFKNVFFNTSDRNDFLLRLDQKNVLMVDIEKSNIDTFKIKEEMTYYSMQQVYYYLNIKENLYDIDIREFITSKFNEETILEFWKELCLDECMRYLDMRTTTMNLGIVKGGIREDIYGFIDDLLLEYSESNIASIIYSAVNTASNFKVEYHVSTEKVHKAIYTNMKNFISRKYRVSSYNRPYSLAQTSLAEIFFNEVIGIDIVEAYKRNINFNLISDTLLKEEYNELEETVKEFIQNNVPKDLVLKHLKVSEELYNEVLESINNDKE